MTPGGTRGGGLGAPGEDRSASGLRVLVVTTVHTPLDARIHHRQVRALLAAGAQVVYAAPWSATGTDTATAAPGVRPVDLPRAVGRRRLRALLAARRLLRRAGASADVVLLHDPELVLAVLGQQHRLPAVVLDVHEDLPASLAERTWLPAALRPVAIAAARRLERLAASRLDGLLLAEHSYRERLPGAHPVVPNLPWLPRTCVTAGRDHRVVYVGRLSRGRGTTELLSLGRNLRAAAPREQDRVRVDLVGAADADVRAEVQAAHAAGDVTWHGFVPNAPALELVEGALAGLAPLHDLANYRGSMPTKVVEYLACGVPAIVTPLPEAVALVRAADAGIIVGFGDLDALTAAVLTLAEAPELAVELGERGRSYVRHHRSWDTHGQQLAAHLTVVAEGRSRNRRDTARWRGTGGRHGGPNERSRDQRDSRRRGRPDERSHHPRRRGRWFRSTQRASTALGLAAALWALSVLPAAASTPCPPPPPDEVRLLPSGERTVALTIDDGPHPEQTPRMLEVLAAHDVRATFFVIGRNVRDHPHLAKRIVDEGHLIANHTFTHPIRPDHMDALPLEQRAWEIDATSRLIEATTGVTPCFYRSPQGYHRSPETLALTHQRGMTVSHWSMSSLDALQPPEEDEAFIDELVQRVTEPLRHGGILLFHDGGGTPKPNSAPAVSRTIEVYREAGFRFVDPGGQPIPSVDREVVHLCPAKTRLGLPFTDVAAGHTHRHAIACATRRGLVVGRSGTEFAPGAPITRGQAATMLDRFLQRQEVEAAVSDEAQDAADDEHEDDATTTGFTDLAPTHTHAVAIERMAAAGLITGRPDGTFGPDAPVRRDQLASMLAAVLRQVHGELTAEKAPFIDVPLDHPHASGVALLASIGVARGRDDGRFEPGVPVARAQGASLLTRTEAWLSQGAPRD